MSLSLHDDAEQWASAAATGGLTETELNAWSDHIRACPACKKLNDEELTMANLIKRSLDAESPDPGFEQRLITRLNQTRIGKGNRWYEYLLFHPSLAAAAASVALAAIVGGGLLMRSDKAPLTGSTVPAATGSQPAVAASAAPQQGEGKGPDNAETTGKTEPVAEANGLKVLETKAPAIAMEVAPSQDVATNATTASLSAPNDVPSVINPGQPAGVENSPNIVGGIRSGVIVPQGTGKSSFTLSDPNAKYLIDPTGAQKVETIANSPGVPSLQSVAGTVGAPPTEIQLVHHHHHPHHHHHRRHHRRHHHPPSHPPATTPEDGNPSQ